MTLEKGLPGTLGLALCRLFGALSCTPRRGPFENMVLVTIDTLRADHLGSYGYPRPTSPFIDSLANEGILYPHAIGSSSHTSPSHTSMMRTV